MAESHREEIAKLEALYAANPGGRVFVHLAEAYRKAGEHERARRILDEGLARHPESASGFVVLGRVLADMQISDDAGAAFRRVLDLDGGNLVALRWLGDLARQSGRSTEAATHYRELLIRNPSNEEVRDLVEIVEREADASSAQAEAATDTLSDWSVVDVAGTPEPEADADARSPSDAYAVSPPIAEAEDAAVSEPRRTEGDEGDVTPWSAAPGQTGDADEAPVEYGLVELETAPDAAHEGAGEQTDEAAPSLQDEWQTARSDAEIQDEPGPAADSAHVGLDPGLADGDTEYGGRESGIVESIEDEGELLELDELRRDDEAGPVEIHLLDPSFDGSEEDDDDYVTDLDLSDLSSAPAFDDEGDYADDSFVADLSAAGQEEPEPDELHVDDVMEAGAALTLLPDTGEPEAAEAAGTPFDGTVADPEEWDLSEPDPAELSGVSEPASEAGTHARREEGTLVTETMAVLYRSQGHHERAAEVYRSLLRARPGDERLAAKLRDAEAAAAASAQSGVAAHGGSREGDGHDDEAGEVWLRGVGTAWTGAEDAVGGDETPYAWTAEPDDGDADEPIGSYLKDLVGWKAGAGRWSPPAEASDADSQGPDFTDVPDWLDGPGGHTEWTPDSAPPVQEATEPAADGAWAPLADAPAGESQGSPPAEITLPDAAPAEAEPEPQSVWSAPAEADTEPEPWGAPGSADEVPAASDSLDGGTEDSGMGWTPLDLDNDIPADATSMGATGEPGDSVAPATESDAGEEGSDDDDLEMFRSWLQSLKK